MSGDDARPGTALPFFAAAAALLFLNAWWLRHFMVDDAFITFRYARNIAEGLGPVFNLGERVEGYSNPLYTFGLALIAKGLRSPDLLPAAARITGVTASLLSLFFLSRFPAGASNTSKGLALVLTATSTSFSLWAVAGLETPVYGCLITAGVLATLARPSRPVTQALTGMLLSLVILSRPEGVLPAGALYLVRFLDPETRGDRRGHVTVAFAMIAPVILYLGFRLLYFHDILPNTWYAKKLPLAEALRKGRWYLVQFIHENGGRWLYLAAPFALLNAAARRAVLVAGLVLAAYVPYILIVGGDWMDQHRFLAPVLPLVYFLVGTGVFAVIEQAAKTLERWPGGPAMRVVKPAIFVMVWLVLALPALRLVDRERREPYVNADPYYTTIGRLIDATCPKTWSVATHDIGAIGWYGRRRVVDLLGLVARDLARGRVSGDQLIDRERPELVVLHYDNRPGAVERWRKPEIAGFDSLYVRPNVAGVPGSLYVRRDRAKEVENPAVFHDMGVFLKELNDLNAWLEIRQPDGQARPVSAPPDSSF